MKKSTILIPLAVLALSGCVFTPSKPSGGTTGGNPTSQQPGPGDSGTPQPGTSDSSGGGGGGGTTDTGGTSVTPTPTGHGTTKEDPLTPQEAIAKCDAAGSGVVVDNFEYFVGGLFDSGTSVNTEHHQWYGNLNGTGFKISGATNDSGVTVDEVNGAMDGKTVVVKGFIELYNNEYKMGYLPASASPTGEKYVPSIVSISSEPAQDAVLNVAINGGNQSVAADGSLTLSATVTVSGSAAKTVSWSSSNSGVATIDSSSGVVSPVAEGKTTIRATSTVDSTKYGEIELTIVPAGSIEHGTTIGDPLTPAEAKALCDDAGDGKIPGPNKEYFVKGEVENAALNSNRYNADFVDSVFKLNSANNDSGVTLADASALNNKIVTAKGYIELYQGTYKMGYLPASASPTGAKYNPSIVAIEEKSTTPTVNSVSVNPTSVTKYTGDSSFTITPTVSVSGGAAQTVSWSVSEGDSVSVNNGTVSIVKTGVSKVRATSTVDSSKYAECTVTVNESAATSVTVTPASQTLQVNTSQAFSSSVEGVGNFTQFVTWSVIPESAGTITSTGMFTAGASAASDVKIRATSDLTPSVYGEATVQIQEAAVTPEITGITGLKASTSLEVGGSDEQLSATVTGVGAFDSSIDWVSADSSKVTVSSTGLIHAVAATTTPVNVTAFAHGDHDISMSCAVTVTEKVEPVIPQGEDTNGWVEQLGPVTGTNLIFGCHDTDTDSGGYRFLDGTIVSSYYPGSTTTIADAIRFTVTEVTGGYTVQATSGSVSGKYLAMISTDEGAHVNGVYQDDPFVFEYISSKTTIGKTSFYDKNFLFANRNNSTQTSISPTNESYWGTNYIARFWAEQEVEPAVNSVSINGGNQSVKLNGSLTLSASVNVSGGASQAVSWLSSNTGVATIDSDGVITPVAEGTTEITATSTFDSTKSATITLTVTPASSETTTSFTLSSADSVTKETVTVSFAKGSGSSAPTWYDAGLRLYANNTVTITCTGNITGISFNWEKQGKKDFATASADVGTYTHPTAAGTGTWTGSATTIVITLGSSGQLQLNSFTVTHA